MLYPPLVGKTGYYRNPLLPLLYFEMYSGLFMIKDLRLSEQLLRGFALSLEIS